MTANEQDIGALESMISARGGGPCLAPAQQRECCIEDVGVSKAGHRVGSRVEGGLAVPDAVQHLWHRIRIKLGMARGCFLKRDGYGLTKEGAY